MRCFAVLGLSLVLGLSHAALGAASDASDPRSPAAELLPADTAETTSSGATFTAPSGWSISSSAGKIVLDPPEGDSHLVLVDVRADNADAAVAAAWASYRPDAHRALKIAMPQAPDDGWEERHLYLYEASPHDNTVVSVLAWRAGDAWSVAIVDATRATQEKRYAAFSLALGSLRAKGYERETFAGKTARPLDAERIAVLTDFVQSMMQKFSIPGVALGLIDGGKVVFLGGFGVKALGKLDAVDADTLFMAGSDTKAMTTLLLAELVDEKKLRWDEPVTEAYPDFKLGDADVTRQVKVMHLVCACTGLPRQDLEWLFNYGAATPASSLAALGRMQPTSRFGETFQYSNLMATAAGYVAAFAEHPGRELGAGYDAAMQTKVFMPLGMTETTFDFAKAMSGNFASPHGADVDGRTVLARMDLNYAVVPIRPAGGMWTSARDLSRYVEMELARGEFPEGRRLVSEENLLARRRPQIRIGEDASYGMGLVVSTEYGIPVVGHGGSVFGYKSTLLFLPDQAVGAVILANSDTSGYLTGGYFPSLFSRRLLEVLFDGRPKAIEQASIAAAQRVAQIAKARERLVIPPDGAEVAKLEARYTNPVLGALRVRAEDGATIFDFGDWHSAVASRKNDDGTISLITIDPTVAGFAFRVGKDHGNKALIIGDAQHKYTFVAAPPP